MEGVISRLLREAGIELARRYQIMSRPKPTAGKISGVRNRGDLEEDDESGSSGSGSEPGE